MKKLREPCTLESCGRPQKAKGLCQKHYQRLWAYGRTGQIRFTGGTLEERLAERYTIDSTTGCWEWTGHIDQHGYGRIDSTDQCNGKSRSYAMAHRISYELHVGGIPEGQFACHRCDNRKCISPAHIFLGTHADNQFDKVAKRRHTRAEQVETAKLTMAMATSIRIMFARGSHVISQLAAIYGLDEKSIWSLLKGQSWQDSPTFVEQLQHSLRGVTA